MTMKTINNIFILLLLTMIILPFHSCLSQINSNSAEQAADSLALQMRNLDERVKYEWTETVNLYNQRNALAEELIRIVDKSINSSTAQTKDLSLSLNKFKSINQSNDVLSNKELFDSFHQQVGDLSQKINKVFVLAEGFKINNSPFQEIQLKMERLENSISVHRTLFNQNALSYNDKIQKHANSKFYKKYPSLGLKFYFKSDGNSKQPQVTF